MLRSSPATAEVAASARGLVRRAVKGSLATIDRGNGYPYASLVTLATDAAGAPTALISKLARHTANLAKDGRASIMVEETGALADPLQGRGLRPSAADGYARGRSLGRRSASAPRPFSAVSQRVFKELGGPGIRGPIPSSSHPRPRRATTNATTEVIPPIATGTPAGRLASKVWR